MAHWLVIVAWRQRNMAEDLQRRFEGRAGVLVDRRRRPGATKPPVRLVPERRQVLMAPEAAMWRDWRDFGFRMAYRGDGLGNSYPPGGGGAAKLTARIASDPPPPTARQHRD
jgi:hypothetical protein